jgi:hypothetical protein
VDLFNRKALAASQDRERIFSTMARRLLGVFESERARSLRALDVAYAIAKLERDPVAMGMLFAGWGSDQQAAFFDGLAKGPGLWGDDGTPRPASVDMQWCYIGQALTPAARDVLRKILGFGEPDSA